MTRRNGLCLAGAALAALAGCPLVDNSATFPQVELETSLGTVVLELHAGAAPLTVASFLQYVDEGFYDGTIFHRVIADFVVQGGGYEPGLVEQETRDPIPNESANGLLNLRGSLAMARTSDPDSATSQFYVNLVDNPTLDPQSGAAGYTVFGRVVAGMEAVDATGAVETTSVGAFADVPVDDVVLITARVLPGTLVLDPAFEQYLQGVQLQAATLVRSFVVNVLGFALDQFVTGAIDG